MTNNVQIEKLTKTIFKSHKVGFIKSRIYSIYLFIINFYPLIRMEVLKKIYIIFQITYLKNKLKFIYLQLTKTNSKILIKKLNSFLLMIINGIKAQD